MADWDWARIVANAVTGALMFYWGRWSQRRDDRKAAERDLAEVGRRFNAWKNRNRGA